MSLLVAGGLAGWNARGEARLPDAWADGSEPTVLTADVQAYDPIVPA